MYISIAFNERCNKLQIWSNEQLNSHLSGVQNLKKKKNTFSFKNREHHDVMLKSKNVWYI